MTTPGGTALPREPTPPNGQARIVLVRLDARQKSAESIQPGCSQHIISTWKPKEEKPMTHHLLNELARRLPGAKVKSWSAQQMADLLYKTVPQVSTTGQELYITLA